MQLVLIVVLLISSALPTRVNAAPVQLVLSVDKTQVTTAETWTYTAQVTGETARPVKVEDVIDLRLQVESMSPDCEEPAPNLVQCFVTAPATITATVQVRRNACEPNLCRDIDWWIHNQAKAPDLRVYSNTVLVHVSRPERVRPRPDVALPWILR